MLRIKNQMTNDPEILYVHIINQLTSPILLQLHLLPSFNRVHIEPKQTTNSLFTNIFLQFYLERMYPNPDLRNLFIDSTRQVGLMPRQKQSRQLHYHNETYNYLSINLIKMKNKYNKLKQQLPQGPYISQVKEDNYQLFAKCQFESPIKIIIKFNQQHFHTQNTLPDTPQQYNFPCNFEINDNSIVLEHKNIKSKYQTATKESKNSFKGKSFQFQSSQEYNKFLFGEDFLKIVKIQKQQENRSKERFIYQPNLRIKTDCKQVEFIFTEQKQKPKPHSSEASHQLYQIKIQPRNSSSIKQIPASFAEKKDSAPCKSSILDSRFPIISAKGYVIYNVDLEKVIKYKKCRTSRLFQFYFALERQVASLTKIMTCLTAINIIDYFHLNTELIKFTIQKSAIKLKGESITLIDLLYGMMLPSGNDAATVISEGLGLFLYLEKQDEAFLHEYDLEAELKSREEQIKEVESNENEIKVDHFRLNQELLLFLHLKNEPSALNLSFRRQFFCMPSRLSKQTKYIKCFRHKQNFQRGNVVSALQKDRYLQGLYWKKLEIGWDVRLAHFEFQQVSRSTIDQGFTGIKTGHTDVAGPCLAASTTINSISWIFIVLNCESSDQRFEDVQRIVKWIKRKEQVDDQSNTIENSAN